MRLTFTRSGGMAGVPSLRIRAVVTLSDATGRVQGDRGYTRLLDPAEACDLLRTIQAASGQGRPADGPPMPDAFTFRFEIEDGSRQLQFSARQGEPGLEDSITRLVEWAVRESDAILRSA